MQMTFFIQQRILRYSVMEHLGNKNVTWILTLNNVMTNNTNRNSYNFYNYQYEKS